MGQQVNYCRVAAVTANEYARVQMFPVRRTAKKRGAKKKATSAVQAALNQKNAEKHLSDLLHLNFTPDDDEIGLDYDDCTRPESIEAALKEVKNFLLRLKRAWAKKTGKQAADFRYVIITERTSTGKIHHHCAFSGGMDVRELTQIWKNGRVHQRAFEFDENGLRALSHYMLKNRLSYRRWSASRNLKQPVQKTNDHRMTMKDLRYINEHPEDVGFIEKKFPGWRVSPRGVEVLAIRDEESGEAQEVMEEGHEAPVMPFITIQLYREDCPYFTRNPVTGKIKYNYGMDWRENFASV